MKYKINQADILEWAKNYNGEPFDGILCDPPYELGFMGKSWDSTGIAFNVELWTELLRICKPGAHLLAFSGSRTYHRMACAIEDAGFEIRDMIEWVYGSGFPKSLNIAKQLDKMVSDTPGVSSEKTDNAVGLNGATDQPSSWDNNEYGGGNAKCPICNKWYISGSPCVCPKEKVTYKTNEAQYWEGYGTALKPAHEPCVLARKPLEGTVAQNCLKHGTGGLNIDGTRVEANSKELYRKPTEYNDISPNASMNASKVRGSVTEDYLKGRFPANLIHDGSDEVVELFPEKSGANGGSSCGYDWTQQGKNMGLKIDKDKGSASRFFYCAKASKSERNAGLEGFEEQERVRQGLAGEHKNTYSTNVHPTVKPLALTKYLATLIKPPTGGRLLVPFSGSGSEMIGALQAGWEYVEGVELTEEYIPIAEARIAHWVKIPQQETLI